MENFYDKKRKKIEKKKKINEVFGIFIILEFFASEALPKTPA